MFRSDQNLRDLVPLNCILLNLCREVFHTADHTVLRQTEQLIQCGLPSLQLTVEISEGDIELIHDHVIFLQQVLRLDLFMDRPVQLVLKLVPEALSVDIFI